VRIVGNVGVELLGVLVQLRLQLFELTDAELSLIRQPLGGTMVLLFTLVLGCNDKGDDSATGDSDTDTDTDTDTDSDTDTDTDPSVPSNPDRPLGNCEELEHQDWDGGWSADEFLRRYDENGNQVYYRSDFGIDHEWDTIATYEYDERWNLIHREWDDEADGVIDQELDYTYDDDDDVLTATESEYGSVVEIRTYTYDESDLLERIDVDAGGDGSVDDVYHVTIAVDGSGNVTTTEELDYGNDGTTDELFVLVENADGTEFRGTIDEDLDGDADFVIEQTYDEYGNEIRFFVELYDAKTDELLLTELTETDALDAWHRIATFHGSTSFSAHDAYNMEGTYTYTCR